MTPPNGTVAEPPVQLREATTKASEQLGEANTNAQTQLATRTYPAGQSIAIGPGLLPKNMEDAVRFAQLVHKSEFIPKAFRGNAGDVLAAVLFGLDIGLPPMQALQTIAVINGRPSVYGDGLLAVVYSLAQFQDHDEFYEVDGQRKDSLTVADMKKESTCAVCVFLRKGRSKPVVRKFSVEQAKTANLWTKDGPWKQYPDRMLMFRARGFAARDAFPDGMRGIVSAEEAQDVAGEVIRSEVVQMPQRTSEQTAATPGGAAPSDYPSERLGTAVSPDAAAAAPHSLPDGLDRISSAGKSPRNNGDGFWWWGKTERGLNIYTFSTTQGPKLLDAFEQKRLVKLATESPDAQQRMKVIDVAIIDGTTGEQLA